MKKRISIISLLAISVVSLSAMELVELTELSKKSLSINGYGSLADNIFGDIEDQQQEQSKSVIIISAPAYLEAVHSSLKLDEWYNKFRALSDGAKRTVLRTVSTQLLYLHAIAFCLPPEVVKDHIVLALLDYEEEAVKNFYDLPFGPAFDLYHDIKSNLEDDTIPVGPLYAKSPQVRELILGLQKNPWYYSIPVISSEDNEEIKLLSDDMKNMYLRGKEILVLPDDEHNQCAPRTLGKNILIGGGAAVGIFGIMSGVGALSGVCCGCGPSFACEGAWLASNGAASSFIFVLGFFGKTRDDLCGLCENSQFMTL